MADKVIAELEEFDIVLEQMKMLELQNQYLESYGSTRDRMLEQEAIKYEALESQFTIADKEQRECKLHLTKLEKGNKIKNSLLVLLSVISITSILVR